MREIKCIDESFKSLAERKPIETVDVGSETNVSFVIGTRLYCDRASRNTLDKACQKEEDGPNKTRVCCRLEITCRPCKLHSSSSWCLPPLSDEERHEEDDESLGLEIFNWNPKNIKILFYIELAVPFFLPPFDVAIPREAVFLISNVRAVETQCPAQQL